MSRNLYFHKNSNLRQSNDYFFVSKIFPYKAILKVQLVIYYFFSVYKSKFFDNFAIKPFSFSEKDFYFNPTQK